MEKDYFDQLSEEDKHLICQYFLTLSKGETEVET